MKSITILCAVERRVGKLLHYALDGYGYQVISVSAVQETIALAAQRAPDLIILDTDLDTPFQGFEVCRELRAWSTAPIFFLSARQDKLTKISALDLGADDYITQPFDVGELEARIRAVLRRIAVQDSQTLSAEICVDDLVFNFVKRRVFLRNKEVRLTPIEYDLLRVLVINAGKVVTHDSLLCQVWEQNKSAPDHYLRVYMNTIRKKLGDAVANPHYIFTEIGIGYRFVDIPTRND